MSAFQCSRRALLLGGIAQAALLRGGAMNSPAMAQGAAGPRRAASIGTTRHMHSGHSLSDAYLYGGGWPGSFQLLRNDVLDPDDTGGQIYNQRSTPPGSSIQWRWTANSEARQFIADFDLLMITESAPGARVFVEADEPTLNTTIDYLMRFVRHILDNGARGLESEVVLWSSWPQIEGNLGESWDEVATDFRSLLPEYGKKYKYLTDYVTWKVHQEYPGIDPDWRAWFIPGHYWMMRVYDDIQTGDVPGITDIAQLFSQVDPPGGTVHTNSIGSYGLACFVFSALYQIDLRTQPRLHIQPAWTETNHPSVTYPAVTRAQAEYFWKIAWELATEYGPVGMGGSIGNEVVFDPARHPDILTVAPSFVTLPAITPEQVAQGDRVTLSLGTHEGVPQATAAWVLKEDGLDVSDQVIDRDGRLSYVVSGATGVLALSVTLSNRSPRRATAQAYVGIGQSLMPKAVLELTPDAYVGPSLSGALPAASGGYRRFSGELALRNDSFPVMGPRYGIAALRLRETPSGMAAALIKMSSANDDEFPWTGYTLFYNGHVDGLGARVQGSGESAVVPPPTEWAIIEWWTDGAGMYAALNGAEPAFTGFEEAPPEHSDSLILWPGPPGHRAPEAEVAAIRIVEGIPDADARDAMRKWAKALIPM